MPPDPWTEDEILATSFRNTTDFISEYYPIRLRGKRNGWWSTGDGALAYGESSGGYRWKDSRLWVKGYGGIRWKGLKRRLFALKRCLFSLKRHLFEVKRLLFNCFHPRQTFLSPNANIPFTYWRYILPYSRQLKLPKWRFTPINMGWGRAWMPHPLGEAKILGKKNVWCFFFV